MQNRANILEQISIKGNTMAVGDNVGTGLAPAQ
jgi:hypothetical protein